MFLYFINSILSVTVHELSDVTVNTKPKVNYNNMTTLDGHQFNNRTVKNVYLNFENDPLVETTKVIKSKNAMVIKDNVKDNAPAHVPRVGRSSHTHKRNKTRHTISKERPGRPLFPTMIATRRNNLLFEHSTSLPPLVKSEDTNFAQSHMVCIIFFTFLLIASIGSLIYVKRRR